MTKETDIMKKKKTCFQRDIEICIVTLYIIYTSA